VRHRTAIQARPVGREALEREATAAWETYRRTPRRPIRGPIRVRGLRRPLVVRAQPRGRITRRLADRAEGAAARDTAARAVRAVRAETVRPHPTHSRALGQEPIQAPVEVEAAAEEAGPIRMVDLSLVEGPTVLPEEAGRSPCTGGRDV